LGVADLVHAVGVGKFVHPVPLVDSLRVANFVAFPQFIWEAAAAFIAWNA
jgi:hypothetical protein